VGDPQNGNVIPTITEIRENTRRPYDNSTLLANDDYSNARREPSAARGLLESPHFPTYVDSANCTYVRMMQQAKCGEKNNDNNTTL